jgi:SAM-dependent methyltransferase
MREESKTELLNEVAKYYASKLEQFGQTPQGVDWNGEASQHLRFEQLIRIADGVEPFSINDLGCGYGALFGYLSSRRRKVTYAGFDVAPSMVDAAAERFRDSKNARFVCTALPDVAADFGVASGIFNVRLGRSDLEWKVYLEETLDVLDRTSRKGFAFNCLTVWSDADRMRDYLYYADPCQLFELCKRRFSRNVAILHDYDLYEFTVLVRKSQ